MNSRNNANPYIPPVPVEEDAPDYDLRKIARIYHRLGVLLKLFVFLLVIDVCLWQCVSFIEKILYFMTQRHRPKTSTSPFPISYGQECVTYSSQFTLRSFFCIFISHLL